MQGNSIYGIFLYREIAFQIEILLDIKNIVYSVMLLNTYVKILLKIYVKLKSCFKVFNHVS